MSLCASECYVVFTLVIWLDTTDITDIQDNLCNTFIAENHSSMSFPVSDGVSKNGSSEIPIHTIL